MPARFIIYGERNSGTNYLQELIETNFDVETTWDFGWKHFFGFNDVSRSDNTLFVCIIRDPYTWINSMYRLPHHITHSIRDDPCKFVNDEIFSYDDNNKSRDETKEMMEDRHIYTGERYKNIFELRYTKLHYLMEDLPKKVKHYLFIRYEDLLHDFNNTMDRIKATGMRVKENIVFPQNTKYDIKVRNQTKDHTLELYRRKTNYPISKELVYLNPLFDFAKETQLGYEIPEEFIPKDPETIPSEPEVEEIELEMTLLSEKDPETIPSEPEVEEIELEMTLLSEKDPETTEVEEPTLVTESDDDDVTERPKIRANKTIRYQPDYFRINFLSRTKRNLSHEFRRNHPKKIRKNCMNEFIRNTLTKSIRNRSQQI